jgi:hypothetical protein
MNSNKIDAVLQMLCVEIRLDDHLCVPTYAHRLYKIMLFINMSPSTCFSIYRHSQGDVNTKEYIISVHQSYVYNVKSTYQQL